MKEALATLTRTFLRLRTRGSPSLSSSSSDMCTSEGSEVSAVLADTQSTSGVASRCADSGFNSANGLALEVYRSRICLARACPSTAASLDSKISRTFTRLHCTTNPV